MKKILAAVLAFITGGWLLRRFRPREVLDWESAPRPGRIEYVDGYGVHVVEEGQGPPIILVHGFGGQTYSFRYLIPDFARDHRVIAVDLKGFGYSERDDDTGLSHTDQAAMLRALMHRLGIDRAVFVGHSMGGAVVQRFAAAYPEMAEAIVLAAAPSANRRPYFALPARFIRPFLPFFAALVTKRLFKYAFANPAFLTDEVMEEYRRPGRIRGSMDGLAKMMVDVTRDRDVDFSRITMPVLHLVASKDRVVRMYLSQELRRQLPHGRMVVIEPAGHLLLEEKPQECIRAIRDFLAEAVGRRAAAAPAAAN